MSLSDVISSDVISSQHSRNASAHTSWFDLKLGRKYAQHNYAGDKVSRILKKKQNNRSIVWFCLCFDINHKALDECQRIHRRLNKKIKENYPSFAMTSSRSTKEARRNDIGREVKQVQSGIRSLEICADYTDSLMAETWLCSSSLSCCTTDSALLNHFTR